MSKHDLHKYQRSIKLTKDINTILIKLNNALSSLEEYKHYNPVKDIIRSMENNKTILEIHLNKERHIMKNKGEE